MSIRLAKHTVQRLVAEELRKEIICGNFRPGYPLRLRDLADQYQVSTMPVREALRQLESDGLVTIIPRRGAIVTKLSADELEEIYDIRTTLEVMATRYAVPAISEETLETLDGLIVTMDQHLEEVTELVRLNFEFHSVLYAASRRNHLLELIQTLRHRTEHYLHAYIVGKEGMPMAQDEHRLVVAACRRGDAEQAAAIMQEHVTKAGNAIVEYLRQGE